MFADGSSDGRKSARVGRFCRSFAVGEQQRDQQVNPKHQNPQYADRPAAPLFHAVYGPTGSQQAKDQVNQLLRQSFRPEFLNRLDEIVFYKPLTKENITSIIDLLVAGLNQRLADKQLTVQLTPAAKQYIIDSAYDPIYGARPLRRFLQHTVETLISKKIIADQVEPDACLLVDCVAGELTVESQTVQDK